MKIVDAHHHLWDLSANHYPWLLDPGTPRLYGDHSPICHDYLLSDFRRDIGDLEVVRSVHVQADSDFDDPVRETRWLQSLSDAPDSPDGIPNAIVAFADLGAPDVDEVLRQHCLSPNMRGIRQALNGIVTTPAKHPNILEDDRWRANVGKLAAHGLSFDLQLFASQMPAAATLVRQHPEVQFILLHAGLPMDRSPAGMAEWEAGIRLLAAEPNVAVKISGFGMFDHAWTVDSIRPLVRTTIDVFGTDRAMFGSNFPVDGMWSSYRRVWEAFLEIVSDLPGPEQAALFHDNACRFYRL